jgi:hypothetical protein
MEMHSPETSKQTGYSGKYTKFGAKTLLIYSLFNTFKIEFIIF